MNIKILKTGAWDYNTNPHDEVNNYDSKLADSIVSFIKEKDIKFVFDFGCSTGYYLKHLSEQLPDLKLTGVEPKVSERTDKHFENILDFDLAEPFIIGEKGTIICLEVLEHIPAQFESIVIDNIKNHCDGYLILSWARPGQGGYGHFNEKNQNDVMDLFTKEGFVFLESETMSCRNDTIVGWLKNNLLIFRYDRS
jgi:hypothetical protein